MSLPRPVTSQNAMSEARSPGCDPARLRQVTAALWLVSVSVAFGMLSGANSVTTGLADHSLGVLADVAGSAVLIWRFRAERRQPGQSCPAEARAAVIVAIALAVVSVALTVQSAAALAAGSRPGTSGVTLGAAAVSLAVLAPLARAKRRLGERMDSRALRGDGTLSAIGAATSALALAALMLNDTLRWWWADRTAALIVALIAAAEAWHTGWPDRCRLTGREWRRGP
ncbi:MAG TPA: cation transporter [Streptosporangiaceae bacterium]|nr:cation transporter [Streptosporangiaceae bacterium]